MVSRCSASVQWALLLMFYKAYFVEAVPNEYKIHVSDMMPLHTQVNPRPKAGDQWQDLHVMALNWHLAVKILKLPNIFGAQHFACKTF